MENRKIMIENLSTSSVGITNSELHLRRTWEKKGAKKPIDLDVLKEAIYDPGVEYMFKNGILGIAEKDSLAILIELGLEEEGTEEPENIIVLTDAQRKRLMTTAPIAELKETLEKLSLEQREMLARFAINNTLSDYQRCQLIKEACGIDIIKGIELKKANEEA